MNDKSIYEGVDFFDRGVIVLLQISDSFYNQQRLPLTEHLTGPTQVFCCEQDSEYPIRILKLPLSSWYDDSYKPTDLILAWVEGNENGHRTMLMRFYHANDVPQGEISIHDLIAGDATASASFALYSKDCIVSADGLNFIDATKMILLEMNPKVEGVDDPVDWVGACICFAAAQPLRLRLAERLGLT